MLVVPVTPLGGGGQWRCCCQVVSTEWHWQAAICLVNYLALNSPAEAEVFAGITDSLGQDWIGREPHLAAP